ncbi:MAG: hypothetical protein ACTSXL_03880 [Alphaproteobacteria bacterium]
MPNSENKNARPQYVVALTLYHEGYGYGLKELESLASVIKNRFDYYQNIKIKKTWEEVCMDTEIFSFWKTDDCIEQPIITDQFFAMCSRIAGRVVSNLLADRTDGAMRFHHNLDLPKWAEKRVGLPIGNFVFYP